MFLNGTKRKIRKTSRSMEFLLNMLKKCLMMNIMSRLTGITEMVSIAMM